MRGVIVENRKIFDDFQEVSCNDCGHYWDDSCDGVKKGSKKVCNSFIATRRIVIPEQIKRLEFRVKYLWWSVVICLISILLVVLGIKVGWI